MRWWIGGVLLAACGHEAVKAPAPPIKPVVASAAPIASAAPSASARPVTPAPPPPEPPQAVSVGALALPDPFTLDGKLDEWPTLTPDLANPRINAAAKLAPSHVVLAVTVKGITIAADLRGSAASGAWLGIAGSVPELGPISPLGFQRGGGVVSFSCETNFGGDPLPPNEAESCKAIVARSEEFRAAYRAKFVRIFRLDKDGVKLVGDKGLETVDGAQVAAAGTTIEATLPLAAMPMVSDSPLGVLDVIGLPAGDPKPTFPNDEDPKAPMWHSIGFADLEFPPLGALRSQLLRDRGPLSVAMGPWLSYHPAAPLEIAVTHYAGTAAAQATDPAPLYVKRSTLGDLEIGGCPEIAGGQDNVVVLKKGEFVTASSLQGHIAGVAKRGSEVHVFATDEDQEGGFLFEHWRVLAVVADGTVREDILDDVPVQWLEVNPGHSPSFDQLWLQGKTISDFGPNGPIGSPLRQTWRWDRQSQRYVLPP